MRELKTWIEALFTSKRVEPNSGLGGALRYMLGRWAALTLFLRVADAPIDNNAVERVLKHAIRHRRASLFYRSSHGARVGDIYTSLIVTTVLHGGDPIRYLTALFENDKAIAAAPASASKEPRMSMGSTATKTRTVGGRLSIRAALARGA